MSTVKYEIDSELGIDHQDEAPWRSYHLTTQGESLYDLIENATVSEIDQDGGELDSYSLLSCGNETWKAAMRLIESEIRESSTATRAFSNWLGSVAKAGGMRHGGKLFSEAMLWKLKPREDESV